MAHKPPARRVPTPTRHAATRKDVEKASEYIVCQLKLTQKLITMKVSAIAGVLQAINLKLDKSKTEIVTEIQRLRTALENQDQDLSPEAQEALTNLEAHAQGLDDINPDAEEPTDPEEEGTERRSTAKASTAKAKTAKK
jgi:hypothetical protein